MRGELQVHGKRLHGHAARALAAPRGRWVERRELGFPQSSRAWRLDLVQVGIDALVVILLPADKESMRCRWSGGTGRYG